MFDLLGSSVEGFFFNVKSVDLFRQLLVLERILLLFLVKLCHSLSMGPLLNLELLRQVFHVAQLGLELLFS